MLTNEEYIAKGGNVCPKCESKKTETASHSDVDAEYAYFVISCDGCDFVWEDQYKLIGFSCVGSEWSV